ncbi:unnamed protein product [Orchesella dallaii]|uniref:Ig-like domain-containing protein n=1 Tax=Orchesella dallaii TaxID=48710 RepID=A0ABP1QLS1_9HEXA
MDSRNSEMVLRKFLLGFTVIVLIIHVEGWRPRQFPKIGVSEFAMQDEEDHHVWETDMEKMPEGALTITDNGKTYIVTAPVLAITIECNASYPLQWNFLHAEDASENIYSVRIRMFRYAKDVYNPLTNSYSSQLQLYGDTNAITGEYTCSSTEYDDVHKTIYIFWQGESPTSLIPQDKTEDVCRKPDDTAVLPCRVSDPDERPKLYYEVKCNDKYKLMDNPYIKYDPKVGFTIDLSQFNGAYGRYRCSMSDDDGYPAYFNLRNETCQPRGFNETIIGRASIRYNKKAQKIICCSNTSKPPSIQGIFCYDPISCKMKEFRLYKNGNNGTPFKNGSCSYEKIYERDSGMVRCKGDGIDVVRPFYTDLQSNKNESFNLYFDWNNLHPEKLIALSANSRKPIYDKQNITINCETSYFYFAEGVKWAARWNNGSLNFLDTDSGLYEQQGASSTFQSIRIPINMNMTEVFCFAPVWNTTEWVNKSFKLDARESFAPKFEDESLETINLKLNQTEQVLICKASGTPLPLLRWRKNNRTVLNENNIAVKRRNGTMVLTIHRVSHDSQGQYKCIASNFAGRVEKVYEIYVIDPGQPLSASAIAFVTLLLCLVVSGMGYLLWRMQLQRKIINHLTGIVFRDVGRPNGSSTIQVNATAAVNRSHINQNGGMEFSTAQVQEPNHI